MKVRGWLKQKSLELFPEVSETFVELVLNLLNSQADDRTFYDKLDRILDKDTRPFIKGLWRYIIFEQLKLRNPFKGRNR